MFNLVTSPACVSVGAGTDKLWVVRVTDLLAYPSVDTRIATTASVHAAMYSRDELSSALLQNKRK